MLNRIFSGNVKLFSIAILIGFSSIAHAQHGSVNGPVDSGSLNPRSGATVISREVFNKATDECYQAMLIDILDPFLNTLTPEMATVNLTDSTTLLVKISRQNQSPLAVALRQRKIESFYISLGFDYTVGKSLKIDFLNMDQLGNFGAYTQFPSIRYDTVKTPQYDEITRAVTGMSDGIKNLRKGYNYGIPNDESSIPLLNNATRTPSYFRLNGKQFFECIESKL